MRCRHLTRYSECSLGKAPIWSLPMACDSCQSYEGPRRGLGDVVHGVIKVLRLDRIAFRFRRSECGCGRRRSFLNRMMPFKSRW
jgi:hypothetical protein